MRFLRSGTKLNFGRIYFEEQFQMREFTVGQILRIPCDVKPGAFSVEYLVTIQTGGESISGFVRKENISEELNANYITAKIVAVKPDCITVQLPGSFFTKASGKTSVTSTWARSNFALAPA